MLGAAVLGSCSDQTERNVITGRPPFFHATLPYSRIETARVISNVRHFANANGMDFLLAQRSLEEGDFNASADGRDLNLSVMHIAAVGPGTVDVFATARSTPTEADKAKVRQFVCVVQRDCQL